MPQREHSKYITVPQAKNQLCLPLQPRWLPPQNFPASIGKMRTHLIALLAMVFISSAACVFAEDAPKKSEQIIEVTLDEAEKLIQTNTNLVILDVRTRKEFATARIPKATNLDLYSPDFEQKLARLDKSKPYLVHCASGGRSAEVRDRMKELGFKTIYHMDGGIRAWQKAGKKTEKPE